MARGKDLAALAGLAGLAYAMRNKDEAPKGKEDTGPGYKSTEERPRKIEDYSKKAPLDGTEMYPSGVMGGARLADKTTVKPASSNQTTTSKDLRDLEASMSRGTRTVPNNNYSNEGRGSVKPASTVSSSEEGMKNYKPRRTPASPSNTVSSSEEGMKDYKPRRTPPTPPFKGGQPGYDEAGNFMGGRRGYDEAGNPMKKGGAVKKMASGGSTASKRADGIASKGKTKCKMY